MAIIDLFLTDENSIKGLSPIESACEMFRVKYLLSGLVTTPYIIVTGDASGRSKSRKLFYHSTLTHHQQHY